LHVSSWMLAAIALGPITSANAQIQLTGNPSHANMPAHLPDTAPALQSGGDLQNVQLVALAANSILMNRNLVEGLPFEARGTLTVEQTLADGSTIKNRYDVASWRDAEGRMRVEYAIALPGLDGPQRMAAVRDPKSGTTATWVKGNPKVPVTVRHMPAAPPQVRTFDRSTIPIGPGSNVQKNVQPPENLLMPNSSTNAALPNGAGSGDTVADGGSYRVDSGISAPVALNVVEADYSDEARRDKYQGICRIQMIVDAQGKPQDPHVIRPLGMGLDEKALEAVRQYRFRPAMMNGATPVPVVVTVEVNFHLMDAQIEPEPVPHKLSIPYLAETASRKTRSEELPAGNIAGLNVTGVRTTTIISAGTAGNDHDITVTSETWTSPDLKITVRQATDDPRSGKVTTELTNIARTDPDPALFQAPEGYTVRDVSLPITPRQ